MALRSHRDLSAAHARVVRVLTRRARDVRGGGAVRCCSKAAQRVGRGAAPYSSGGGLETASQHSARRACQSAVVRHDERERQRRRGRSLRDHSDVGRPSRGAARSSQRVTASACPLLRLVGRDALSVAARYLRGNGRGVEPGRPDRSAVPRSELGSRARSTPRAGRQKRARSHFSATSRAAVATE